MGGEREERERGGGRGGEREERERMQVYNVL